MDFSFCYILFYLYLHCTSASGELDTDLQHRYPSGFSVNLGLRLINRGFYYYLIDVSFRTNEREREIEGKKERMTNNVPISGYTDFKRKMAIYKRQITRA